MTGRREALLVATSTYRDPRFQQLMAPVNDVRALGGVFADPELGGFAVQSVLNKDAHVVMQQIEEFCADRVPADTVLLYFSCHGITSDTGDLFLVTRNTNRDRLLSTGVPDTFLRSVLRRCRADIRILILDCCFGGAFSTDLLAKGDADTVNLKATFAEAGSGLVVLTASNARESAFEEVGDGSRRNSVFTRTLVDGISTGEADLDGDGVISADDLYTFATTRIATNQSRQTPTMTTIGAQGRIVLAKARPRPVANTLDPVPGFGAGPSRGSDLRPWARVHDAGADGANAAMAAVTAMETNLAYQGSPVSLSARYLYARCNRLAKRPPSTENGIGWDVLPRALTDYGTVPEEVWPYRSGEWALPAGTTMADLDRQAKQFRARLFPVRSLAALLDELDHGRPVLCGFTVFDNTWTSKAVASTGLVGPPAAGDRPIGNIAVTIVDVDPAARLLRFAHTWGPSWGDRGFGSITFDTAQQLLVFDQMWSVQVDVARGAGFRWDLTDPRPAPPPAGGPTPVDTGSPAAAPAPPRPGAPGRPPRKAPTGPPAKAPAPRPRPRRGTAAQAADLDRTVFDGRLLGASYARLDPKAALRTEGGPRSRDAAANQVFDTLGAFHRLLKEAFDRSSWDGRGGPYRAIVHYGRDYDNAFWDGSARVVVLGDGDGRLLRGFYGVDVVAKELGNALASTMTRLAYRGQSGALFNSLSLVVASIVKQYAAGQTADQADWLVGEGLLGEGVQGRALSDLLHPGTAYDDPGLGTDPSVGHLDQYVRTSDDNGGIHLNSGIPARAFALAATALGGPSWEGAGLAWYRAMASPKLSARATFASFAGLTVAEAPDRATAAAVGKAWKDVGVTVAAR